MLLCTNLARGGAETQVALLAAALHRRGVDVCVVSLLEPSAYAEELRASGIPVHSLGMRPGRPSIAGILRLLSHLRQFRPAVLHAHLFHANLFARLVRLLCPIPVVISTIHSMAESGRDSARIGTRDRLYQLTDWLSDRSVCVSRAVAERHAGAGAVSAARMAVIPNGLDPARFVLSSGTRERVRASLGLGDGFVWLAAGRLMWKKDYVTMLEAMARLPEATLLIAGDGPLSEELRTLARPLGERVRFLGLREDVAELMLASDGFVLSSVVEGLPMVLMEAAMSGLPSVATGVGGVREIVVDGETGFVVPPKDPAALAAAMQRLANLPREDRLRLGDAARRHALASFDLDGVAAEWENLYRDGVRRAAGALEP
jgi:glycosyltransferase involved in cell wall biosynthesis